MTERLLGSRFEKASLYTLERQIKELQELVENLRNIIQFIPNPEPPANPEEGMLAFSDGTNSGFDGVKGAGLYEYVGGVWVKL